MAIFENNCWLQRTPLETALILILIVAVPFLTAMIVIYSILLVQKCPNYCSRKCSEVCARKPANSSVISMLLQLNPNISLTRLSEKYEICPDSMLEHFGQKVDHAFVASVLEDVYEDVLTPQRYLCSAAVITFKWVVSSSICFESINRSYTDNIVGRVFVRAGSNYWIAGGSVHGVKQVVFADKTTSATVAAIELKTAFPRLSSIRPIMLSRKSLYTNFGIAESYKWDSNDSVPFKYRKKHVKLYTEPFIIFKDVQCFNMSDHQLHVFCSQGVGPKNQTCMMYSGFPVARARILLGVNIGGFCDLNRNITVYLIYDITGVLYWLEKITGVYVEHF